MKRYERDVLQMIGVTHYNCTMVCAYMAAAFGWKENGLHSGETLAMESPFH